MLDQILEKYAYAIRNNRSLSRSIKETCQHCRTFCNSLENLIKELEWPPVLSPYSLIIQPHMDGKTWFIHSIDKIWWMTRSGSIMPFRDDEPCDAMQYQTQEEAEKARDKWIEEYDKENSYE